MDEVVDLIDVEIEEKIALIKINNPPMNAVCEEMLDELELVLEDLKGEKVRSAIVTGEGDAFIAGADIKEMKEMSPEEAREFSRRGQKIFNNLRDLPFPVIGAINGYALGGGLELALSCDFLVASEEALFGQPEVGLGVIPGFGGTFRLREAVGPAKSKELIFTGKRIDAEQAKEWDIVNHVVGKDELMEETRNIAEEIIENSPVAVEKAKKAINLDGGKLSQEVLKIESDRFEECFKAPDQEEGMEAFLEKRDPDF